MTLLDRVRDHLAAGHPVERRMFGGTSFMVGGRMLLAVRGDRLLLRIDPDDRDELLARGAEQAFMGPDRSMGSGWVTVDASLLDGPSLARWVAHAGDGS